MRFAERTIARGIDYYLQGHVIAAEIDRSRVTARVRGTQQLPYTVVLDHNRPQRSHCSCPVGFACKHLVAVIASVGNDARVEPMVRHRVRSIAVESGILDDELSLGELYRVRPVFSTSADAAVWRLALLVDCDAAWRPTVYLGRQHRRRDGQYGRLDALHPGDVVFVPDEIERDLAERIGVLGGAAPLVALADELLRTMLPVYAGNPNATSGAHTAPVRFVRPERYELDLVPFLLESTVSSGRHSESTVVTIGVSATLTVSCTGERFVVPSSAFGSFDVGLGSRVASFPEAGVVLVDDESSPLTHLCGFIGAFGRVTPQSIAELTALAETWESVTLHYPRRIRVEEVRPEPVFVLSVDDQRLNACLELRHEDSTDACQGDEYVIYRTSGAVATAALNAAIEVFGDDPCESQSFETSDEDDTVGPWYWSLRTQDGAPDPLTVARELSARGFTVYIRGPGGRRRVRTASGLSVHVTSGINWFAPVASEPGAGPLDTHQLHEIAIRGGFDDGESFVLFAVEEIERIKRLLSIAGCTPAHRLPREDIASLAELADIADDVEQELGPVVDLARAIVNGCEPPAFPMPAGLKASLRPYQRAGFAWLAHLARYGLSGCLADDMGLGKTLQALALMLHLEEAPEVPTGSDGASAGPQSDGSSGLLRGEYLVIAPLSTLGNWQREAARFAPRLSSRVHHGGERAASAVALTASSLVVTSYATAVRDHQLLSAIRWKLVVLDEAQAIKNPHSRTANRVKMFPSDLRLCLTGTPVENVSADLFSIMDFLVPGLLGSFAGFSARFPRRNVAGSSQSAERLARLRRIVAPFLLRRTKEVVAPELPPKIETTLTCRMGAKQAFFYEQLRAHHHALVRLAIKSGDIRKIGAAVFTGLLRLRQAAIYPPASDPAGDPVPSVKADELVDRLEEVVQEGHRALVFSQFVSALAAFHDRTAGRGIATLYLDGQTRNRDELIAAFQGSDRPVVFFISLKAGGFGINLTAADHVFICDPWWNPQVERQAVDRAHRIGRDRPVIVTRLVTEGTIEEKVLELQAQKRKLADELISENTGAMDLRSGEELLALFEK